MNRKIFSQRFNSELALQGYPTDFTEKKSAVSRAFGVNGYWATAMIFGYEVPSKQILGAISRALQVCPEWLVGTTDRKRAYTEAEC